MLLYLLRVVASSKDAMSQGWTVSYSREPVQSGNVTTLLFVAHLQTEDAEAPDNGRLPWAIRLTSECGGKTYKSVTIATTSKARTTKAVRLFMEK